MKNNKRPFSEWRFKELDGELAVCGYKGLDKSVVIPDCVDGRRVTRIAAKAFLDNITLTEVVVPEGITHIGTNAFMGCERLSDIVLPRGLQVIGEGAFIRCNALIEIRLPVGLREIGKNAFLFCPSLERIEFSEGLAEIKAAAFYGCAALTSVVLPKGLIALGESAFSGCEKLEELALPETLREIGTYIISGVSKIEKITIPEGMTVIGRRTFENAFALTRVDMPDTVTRIEDYAFHGCRNLSQIRIPSAISYIGEEAFSGTGITEIDIPNGTIVKNCAFSTCHNLKRVHADGREIKLGTRVFNRCRSIEELHLSAKNAAYIDRYDAPNEIPLYVYSGGMVSIETFDYLALTEKAVRCFLSEYERGSTDAETGREWAEYLKKRLVRSGGNLRSLPAVYKLMVEHCVLNRSDIDALLEVTDSAECRAMLLSYADSIRSEDKRGGSDAFRKLSL